MKFNNIPRRYQELAQKWLDGSATPEEKQEFDNWYRENSDEELSVPDSRGANDEEYRNRLWRAISKEIGRGVAVKTYRLPWRGIAAASVLAGLLAIGGWFLFGNKSTGSVEEAVAASTDILPGTDKATLTLGDGTTIELDSTSSGALSKGAGYVIHKTGGELIYEELEGKDVRVTYNVIRTPRGGQFRLTLPDGSRVWLNSESSLRYPTVFSGKDRVVELNGEGYFEVTKNVSGGKSRPFKINVNNSEIVEVLGTSFNIMAYANERGIKTTLLEGSVKVDKIGTNISQVLKPGQQSVYTDRDGFQIRSDINAYDAISWKDGIISYRDADVPAIMRYLERWYDVKVVYEGEVPKRSFTGGFSRNLPLSRVMKVLELNDIRFRFADGQITVLP